MNYRTTILEKRTTNVIGFQNEEYSVMLKMNLKDMKCYDVNGEWKAAMVDDKKKYYQEFNDEQISYLDGYICIAMDNNDMQNPGLRFLQYQNIIGDTIINSPVYNIYINQSLF